MLLIDGFSRMTWVTFLKEKSEALEKIKAFKVLVENEKVLKVKCLCSSNGGKFTSKSLSVFVKRMG